MMRKLMVPKNEAELVVLRSLLDNEGIPYYVHNDHFGSLKAGPVIELFNARTIMVPNNQYQAAKKIIENFNSDSPDSARTTVSKQTFSNKVRMVLETLVFSWFIPGKKFKK